MNDKLLVKTIQECSELIQIITKIQEWGLDNFNPYSGKSNTRLLTEEVADVLSCLDLVIEQFKLEDFLEDRIRAKTILIRDFTST